jgi:hypothetical protein
VVTEVQPLLTPVVVAVELRAQEQMLRQQKQVMEELVHQLQKFLELVLNLSMNQQMVFMQVVEVVDTTQVVE